MNWKRLFWYLVLVLVFSVVAYAGFYLDYALNRAFIEANMDALPFQYKFALGFGHFEWWAFVTAIGICALGLIGFLLDD